MWLAQQSFPDVPMQRHAWVNGSVCRDAVDKAEHQGKAAGPCCRWSLLCYLQPRSCRLGHLLLLHANASCEVSPQGGHAVQLCNCTDSKVMQCMAKSESASASGTRASLVQ